MQAVEGCMYGESLMTVLKDLGLSCKVAELNLDNTASISFINGAGSQRTRHLKVRAHKIRQLIQGGWSVRHCKGEWQKADLLTKPLPSPRTRFLCELLQLGEDSGEPRASPSVKKVTLSASTCLPRLLALLQACGCAGSPDGEFGDSVQIEWPWELALVTLLVILSTLFVWEASRAPCRRGPAGDQPRVRSVTTEGAERRFRRLQDRVAAAIDAAVSESSPTGDEGARVQRRGRNKCPTEPIPCPNPARSQGPTVVYGGINMHMHSARASDESPTAPFLQPAASIDSTYLTQPSGATGSSFNPNLYQLPVEPAGSVGRSGVDETVSTKGPGPSRGPTKSQAVQTEHVMVLASQDRVFLSEGGDCVHCCENCRGLRQAGHVKSKKVCQYCIRSRHA